MNHWIVKINRISNVFQENNNSVCKINIHVIFKYNGDIMDSFYTFKAYFFPFFLSFPSFLFSFPPCTVVEKRFSWKQSRILCISHTRNATSSAASMLGWWRQRGRSNLLLELTKNGTDIASNVLMSLYPGQLCRITLLMTPLTSFGWNVILPWIHRSSCSIVIACLKTKFLI